MGPWGQCQLCPVYLPAAVTCRSKLRVMYILCSGFLTFIKYINYLLNSWWKYKYNHKKCLIECNRARLRDYRTRLRLVDYDYATIWKIWLRLQLRLRSNCNRLQSITIVIDPNPAYRWEDRFFCSEYLRVDTVSRTDPVVVKMVNRALKTWLQFFTKWSCFDTYF